MIIFVDILCGQRANKNEHMKELIFASGNKHIATHEQENFFLDGPSKELSSRMAVLRIRFYDVDKRALVTLKGKQKLVDGVGRVVDEGVGQEKG